MTDALFLLDTDQDDLPINSDELHTGWNVQLPKSVQRHALDAMRLTVGDTLQLSDGNGLRIQAMIMDTQEGIAQVKEVGKEAQPITRLALIQALAKQGHDEQAIDAATQIGVDAVFPWQSERSIAKWKDGRTDRKWLKVLQSATEQSRRAWLPQLGECLNTKSIVAICRRACVHGDMVIVLHQDATASWAQIEKSVDALSQRCLEDGKARTITVIVGPEGGISESEVRQFVEAGAQSCVLGNNILRASTAGPVALSLLARALGRFV